MHMDSKGPLDFLLHKRTKIENTNYRQSETCLTTDYLATPERGNLLLSCELRAGAQSEYLVWADFDKRSWQMTGPALIPAIMQPCRQTSQLGKGRIVKP